MIPSKTVKEFMSLCDHLDCFCSHLFLLVANPNLLLKPRIFLRNCVKAEGDLDGLYAAMGLGYFARCAMERAQWGAGHLSRSYEHQGERG